MRTIDSAHSLHSSEHVLRTLLIRFAACIQIACACGDTLPPPMGQDTAPVPASGKPTEGLPLSWVRRVAFVAPLAAVPDGAVTMGITDGELTKVYSDGTTAWTRSIAVDGAYYGGLAAAADGNVFLAGFVPANPPALSYAVAARLSDDGLRVERVCQYCGNQTVFAAGPSGTLAFLQRPLVAREGPSDGIGVVETQSASGHADVRIVAPPMSASVAFTADGALAILGRPEVPPAADVVLIKTSADLPNHEFWRMSLPAGRSNTLVRVNTLAVTNDNVITFVAKLEGASAWGRTRMGPVTATHLVAVDALSGTPLWADRVPETFAENSSASATGTRIYVAGWRDCTTLAILEYESAGTLLSTTDIAMTECADAATQQLSLSASEHGVFVSGFVSGLLSDPAGTLAAPTTNERAFLARLIPTKR